MPRSSLSVPTVVAGTGYSQDSASSGVLTAAFLCSTAMYRGVSSLSRQGTMVWSRGTAASCPRISSCDSKAGCYMAKDEARTFCWRAFFTPAPRVHATWTPR